MIDSSELQLEQAQRANGPPRRSGGSYWLCQSCGQRLDSPPKGTAGICIICGGTSALAKIL